MPRTVPAVEYEFETATIPEAPNPFTAVVRALADSETDGEARSFRVPTDPKTGEPVKKATIANQLSKAGKAIDVKVRSNWKQYPERVTIWVVEYEDADDESEDAAEDVEE